MSQKAEHHEWTTLRGPPTRVSALLVYKRPQGKFAPCLCFDFYRSLRCEGSPRGPKEVRVGGQRLLDHLLESLLLGCGLLHPLLGHLLEDLLLLLGQPYPLLRGLMECLSRGPLPLLLWLL